MQLLSARGRAVWGDESMWVHVPLPQCFPLGLESYRLHLAPPDATERSHPRPWAWGLGVWAKPRLSMVKVARADVHMRGMLHSRDLGKGEGG